MANNSQVSHYDESNNDTSSVDSLNDVPMNSVPPIDPPNDVQSFDPMNDNNPNFSTSWTDLVDCPNSGGESGLGLAGGRNFNNFQFSRSIRSYHSTPPVSGTMAEKEEEEDDYMGDLSQFLPPDASSLPSKTAPNKPVVSNKKRKVLKWQERKKLKRERKQIEEDQKTLVNLESAIPESNIGFKMLKQMGYTPGSALGKEGSGRSEPVGLEIRRGRAGIGKEDDKVEKMRREMEKADRDTRTQEELMETFGSHLKERWKEKRTVTNFHKAEAVLALLENREVVEEKKEDDGEKDEEEEEPITEEDLLNTLMKLRDEYHYCLFCGCQYESTEALLSNCPGITEEDH
ncbi:hypothetical protein RND71_008405 [Anisodus tanguticus]|uniref:G-patch domain-containing protein n=1 Tax=Anisodus tanguticus TaxID=243964 RepID=A0AAE1SNS5_9SOLA|nr:hypothetical protein RND71_008405 [Anisodus tanguticus]